jgi:hypothetical protein
LAPSRRVTLIPRDANQAARMAFKRPASVGEVHYAADPADIIREWAAIRNDANLGIAMGRCSGWIFGLHNDARALL